MVIRTPTQSAALAEARENAIAFGCTLGRSDVAMCAVHGIVHPTLGDVERAAAPRTLAEENARFLELQAQIQAENQRFVTIAEYMRERVEAPKGGVR